MASVSWPVALVRIGVVASTQDVVVTNSVYSIHYSFHTL